MPNWKAHIGLGFLGYLGFVILFNLEFTQSFLALGLLAFASILPDLDHPKSVARMITSVLGAFLGFIFVFQYVSGPLLFKLAVSVLAWIMFYVGIRYIPLKHRGGKSLHQWRIWLFILAFFFLIFSFLDIGLELATFVLLGFGIHLLLDKIKRI